MLYPALWGDERASRDTAMLYTKPPPRMLLATVRMNPVAIFAKGRLEPCKYVCHSRIVIHRFTFSHMQVNYQLG
jgi:hypothetical protein